MCLQIGSISHLSVKLWHAHEWIFAWPVDSCSVWVWCVSALSVFLVLLLWLSNQEALPQSSPFLPFPQVRHKLLSTSRTNETTWWCVWESCVWELCKKGYFIFCYFCKMHICKSKGETILHTVPFGYLRVNLAQCICDTCWHWAARQTAGGSTCLQIPRGLQSTAIVVLHT